MRSLAATGPGRISLVLIFICCCGFGAPSVACAEPLPQFLIMTEDWVPYQFNRDGELVGVSVDLMVLLLDRVGSSQGRGDIQLLPWARAYRNLQTRRDTILFSTTRTPERESLFRWVGPIFQNTTHLIAKKSKRFRIRTAADLVTLRIGTIIDDASEVYVQRLGIDLERVQRNVLSANNVEKLEADRIDVVVSGWLAFESDANAVGVDPGGYESVFEVATEDVSFAFHRDTPDWILRKFQSALDDVRAEGALDELKIRYGFSAP